MDPTETGGNEPDEKAGEEKAPDAATEKVPAAPGAQAAEYPPAPADKPPKKDNNWTLIALIAVSVVALLLLIATIGLAVTGDFGHNRRFERFERPGGQPGPMMRFRGEGQRQDGPPWQQRNQDNGAGQNQPQQSAPTAPQGGQSQ